MVSNTQKVLSTFLWCGSMISVRQQQQNPSDLTAFFPIYFWSTCIKIKINVNSYTLRLLEVPCCLSSKSISGHKPIQPQDKCSLTSMADTTIGSDQVILFRLTTSLRENVCRHMQNKLIVGRTCFPETPNPWSSWE